MDPFSMPIVIQKEFNSIAQGWGSHLVRSVIWSVGAWNKVQRSRWRFRCRIWVSSSVLFFEPPKNKPFQGNNLLSSNAAILIIFSFCFHSTFFLLDVSQFCLRNTILRKSGYFKSSYLAVAAASKYLLEILSRVIHKFCEKRLRTLFQIPISAGQKSEIKSVFLVRISNSAHFVNSR